MVTLRPASTADGPQVARVYVDSWNDGFGNLMPPAVLDDGRIARWSTTLATGNWWVAENGPNGHQVAYRLRFLG
ncbi:hypothetical protein ACWGID_26020 [Kribbella sp. NPDC054772]